jgi:glyoxylase-like metal-dependent hydrolase (beta-lactamase superfamily II)
VLTPDGAVLIDPSEPAEADRRRWEQLVMPGGRPPIATLLTSSWHERSCYVLRDRYGIPVWLPAAGAADMDEAHDAPPEHLFDDMSALPGGLRPIAVATAAGGDTVFRW